MVSAPATKVRAGKAKGRAAPPAGWTRRPLMERHGTQCRDWLTCRHRPAAPEPPGALPIMGRVSCSGFSAADAQGDFSRARRARLLADIGRRLRREPDDVALILPFEEVVDALGATGRADMGLQVVPLEAIVGTVDRAVDFDRGFRPTSPRLRSRWERIAAAQRRGESLPPISLFRVGRPVLRARRPPPRVGREVARAR